MARRVGRSARGIAALLRRGDLLLEESALARVEAQFRHWDGGHGHIILTTWPADACGVGAAVPHAHTHVESIHRRGWDGWIGRGAGATGLKACCGATLRIPHTRGFSERSEKCTVVDVAAAAEKQAIVSLTNGDDGERDVGRWVIRQAHNCQKATSYLLKSNRAGRHLNYPQTHTHTGTPLSCVQHTISSRGLPTAALFHLPRRALTHPAHARTMPQLQLHDRLPLLASYLRTTPLCAANRCCMPLRDTALLFSRLCDPP